MNQVGQRRSPQTVEGLFDGLNIVNLHPDHAALFISLCQCTGWSAERIASVFCQKTNVLMTGEQVYTFFWAWYRNRNRKKPSSADIRRMLDIIQASQVDFSGVAGRPLNETAQPVSLFSRFIIKSTMTNSELVEDCCLQTSVAIQGSFC